MQLDLTKKYALIVAGGSGKRMESGIPKQFLPLQEKPVLMHTIEAFHKIQGIKIIVVLPSSNMEDWKKILLQYSFSINHILVEGGETRFHSVLNGLQKVENESIVAIHDGVRPIISSDIIQKSFDIASQKGNAIAAVKLKDSIREMTIIGSSKNVNRNNYFLIQTPQTFQSSIIKDAYQKATHYNFTDDASVAEEISGVKINLFEGDYRNIKITTPEDLIIASAFLAS
jgi:2-C-methyl-D-erythritol 4-phosphate cytidylyltransferase